MERKKGGGGVAPRHNDRQLALLLKNDPARGLEAALDRYGGAVKVICAAILGAENRQEVEEAISDSFVALWKGLDKYDPEQPLSSWLYGIARRTAMNRRKQMGRTAPALELTEELPGEEADLTDQAAAQENARLLRQAVTELPPPDKEIFIRRYYLYETVNGIAARLGLPPKTVENKLCRGRQRLRRTLMERGVIL
ncbi:MAG: sigma-70 family RNA polymerase sigma factor [Angelakisella sp.]|jgi:RNA polymerase sigma-70 factor (ECF subfamily)|nr:sigma-70 family RNA polymerase sigma factor [Angelakisella sp.]